MRDAAAARTADLAQQATDLPALIGLIDRAIPADLPEAIPAILARIEELSAISTDLGHGGGGRRPHGCLLYTSRCV